MRRVLLPLLGLGAVLAALPRAALAQTAGSPAPLRICLLSGNEEPIYRSNENLAALKTWLEANHPFTCELVRPVGDGARFDDIDALARADAAVIFVRRKTPDAETLAAIRKFFSSGRGVVALRTASHAWQNWPEFDVEVLGAKYGSHSGAADSLRFVDPDHPLLAGALDLLTHNDIYRYELRRQPPALQVLLEGDNAKGSHPVAWTTEHHGARIFYLGLGHNEEFAKPAFLRLIANGLFWVNRRAVPGAELRVERTYMADAAPSAFAIGFANGVSFCYDPVRGGLNYVWDGGFVNLAPVRPGMGKLIQPAGLLGAVVYRERGAAPLRHGDPARVPLVQFQGYRVGDNLIEFHYTLDGATVREEIRPRPNGDGLTRRFRFDAPAASWWYLPGPQEGAPLSAPAGQPEAGGFRFDVAAGGEFTLEIIFRKADA